MNMQTLAKGDAAAQKYTAVTFNQQVQGRSTVKGYFLNREGIEDKNKTASGYYKHPDYETIQTWIVQSISELSPDMIKQSFLHCGKIKLYKNIFKN